MSIKDLESWVTEVAKLVAPEKVHWCDGSEEEKKFLIAEMLETGDLLKLNEIAAEKQHNTKEKIVDLKVKQRWYTLDDDVIDITRVEVKDTDGRYVMIPKLADPHKLLKGDTDEADDSLV